MKLKIGKKKKKEIKEMPEEKETDFVEKRIDEKKKELDELKNLVRTKELEIGKLQKIGDAAMYVADVLDMINEYRGKNYNDIGILLSDMEKEVMKLIEKKE